MLHSDSSHPPGCEITIEFFGIPRQRARIDRLDLSLDAERASLGEVMRRLTERLPEFAAACLEGERLRPQYAANIDGQRFVTDAASVLHSGQTLLILSADAGG